MSTYQRTVTSLVSQINPTSLMVGVCTITDGSQLWFRAAICITSRDQVSYSYWLERRRGGEPTVYCSSPTLTDKGWGWGLGVGVGVVGGGGGFAGKMN
jgi:hypothetical protein